MTRTMETYNFIDEGDIYFDIEDEDEDEYEDYESYSVTGVESSSMPITDFVEFYKESMFANVANEYAPIYEPKEDNRQLPKLVRSPKGAQEIGIRALSVSLENHRGSQLVAEMGTGKTFMSIAAADMTGMKRVVVICPTHLVRKWQKEVLDTIPNATAIIVRSITDLENLRQIPIDNNPVYAILSKEKMKLGYKRKCSAIERRIFKDQWNSDNLSKFTIRNAKGLCCPFCYFPVIERIKKVWMLVPNASNPTEYEKTKKKIASKRLSCAHCNEPLWSAHGKPKIPLSDYIKAKMNGFFDLLIADEAHQYKAGNSAQGISAGIVAESCKKTLILTGTFMGGYSSTMFYVLYRLGFGIRDKFTYKDVRRWVKRYGFMQWDIKYKDSDNTYYGTRSRRTLGRQSAPREIPGLSPSAMLEVLPNTVFLKLQDVVDSLPPYKEEVQVFDLETIEAQGIRLSQNSAYTLLENNLGKALRQALANGDMSLLGAYINSILAYPDGCIYGEYVEHPHTKETIINLPPLPDNKLYPKEKALLKLIREENNQGRKVLVYVRHTNVRDITPRIQQIIEAEGYKCALLRASVSAEKRSKWVDEQVAKGIDVLMCQPRLVETGLDLLDFPTICWFETEYSVYTMRQASRRSWRIGQTQPVKVIYMAYKGTAQEQAIRINAAKMRTSMFIEGDIPEGGLAAFGETSESLTRILARSIAEGETIEGSLENIFETSNKIYDKKADFITKNSWMSTIQKAKGE